LWSRNHSYVVTLPVGLNVPVSRSWDLVLEVTPLFKSSTHAYPLREKAAYVLAVAVGSAWFMRGHSAPGGFFLQPKLVGVISYDARDDFRDYYNAPYSPVGRQLSFGLDVGYRVTVRDVVLDFIVGGSMGWGWNVPDQGHSLFRSLLDVLPEGGYRTNRFVWDPNLHLVRLGFTF
jgi:hypothetical protein